ncbi:MAG TPA: Holliday junction resolvase RuvX [Actinomycetota bacterium]|nr:Holliday junction resolvase RuvX [Actinomycetota bacterium]
MSPTVMGLDPGSRRIGVAVSDGSGKIAMPKAVIDRTAASYIDELSAIVKESAVSEVVVGLPLNMDGSEGPSARSARDFAAEIEKELDLPVRLLDERLTTVSVQSSMRRSGVTSRDQKGKIDKVAATLILQSFLDSRTT